MSNAPIKRAESRAASGGAKASAKKIGAKRVTRPRKGSERVTLRSVREAMGKTQTDVARALDTDQGEVSRIERRPDVFVSTIRRYAEALGARCDVVLTFSDGRRVLIAEPEPEDAQAPPARRPVR